MKTKSFWVIGCGALSQDDLSTITLLYQPLIDAHAYGLYLFFNHLQGSKTYQSEIYTIRFLMDILNLKEKELEEALSKLEAIGLLTTYIKQDLYMFKLSMPLSPRQFFSDGILGAYLKSEIGESNFKILYDRFSFKEISKEGYQNITKHFDQVYQVKMVDQIKSNDFILDRKNGKGVVISDDYDFDKLYAALPIRLQKKRLFTKKIQSQIAAIFYVYQFDIEAMVRILSDAYDENFKHLFYERISIYADKYYEKHHGTQKLEVDIKNEEPDRLNLSEISPQDIISMYAPTMTNHAFALQTIRQFVERNAVDIAIINAVIIIVLRVKKNLPNINYLEKVLTSLLEKGITTEALAYDYIMNGSMSSKKTYYQKQKTERYVPEWMAEFEALLEGND